MSKKLQAIFNFLIIFFISISFSKAELINPRSDIKPSEVVKIQLLGLQTGERKQKKQLYTLTAPANAT